MRLKRLFFTIKSLRMGYYNSTNTVEIESAGLIAV